MTTTPRRGTHPTTAFVLFGDDAGNVNAPFRYDFDGEIVLGDD